MGSPIRIVTETKLLKSNPGFAAEKGSQLGEGYV